MTLLLVMLHSGTMFSVIVYFWNDWRQTFFRNIEIFRRSALLIIMATALTGAVGEVLVQGIETALSQGHPKAEVEQIFGHLELISPALFTAGVLILISGLAKSEDKQVTENLSVKQTMLIGAVQGLAIPFRGFSRSGSTISAGLFAGVEKRRAEAFSFALAVMLTPPVVFREVRRLIIQQDPGAEGSLVTGLSIGIIGMLCAFVAGLLALKWLSTWLESGRWYIFGIYCIVASGAVFAFWRAGY
jgi:undecaprenyl-diphosphatase